MDRTQRAERAEEHALARARAVRARGNAIPPEGLPHQDILDSWVRCAEAGLDFAAPPEIPVIEAIDLSQRRQRLETVRRLALAELETLFQQIAGSNFMLAFADGDGVVLDLYADNRFRMSGPEAGLQEGSCWSESAAGTNGLGTALATGHAVAVTGLEHYYLRFGDISCTAAPIHDAQGRRVAALDASSYYESRQRHTQALVQMAATHVENLLLVQQMQGHAVLALHPRAEFLGTISAGLLAFDGEGRVSAHNGRASGLLAGLELARGTLFEDLFDEPYERALSRLGHRGELRLRDRLGSSLMAKLVDAPRPARLAASAPRAAPVAAATPQAFVADDPAVQAAMQTVAGAVRLRAPILIHGETGTGKELLARYAHSVSGRRGAFVGVNCAALPAELFEAELFGYTSGAYTGARRQGSPGLIASADGGTLLLDELGELPLTLQAALLRFLDDQQVRPVGGTATRQVDVQLLAATHTDLELAVQARTFRGDLLNRLNTVRVDLPPLRARADFPAIARSVLATVDRHAEISEAAVQALSRHAWPGNVRELRSVLTRALLIDTDGRLGLPELERVLPGLGSPPAPASALQLGAREQVLREFERSGRSVSATSRNLGISRTTVYRYLRQGPAQATARPRRFSAR